MKLQPKTFKSKKRQKGRYPLLFNKYRSLQFGDSGLRTLGSLIFTSSHLEKMKLFLRKARRKSDKTHRRVWFNLFPHLPLSKKSANVRMGKGKGKLKTWFINVRAGSILVEYSNLRYGRAVYFFEQTSYRLGVPVTKIFNKRFFFSYPFRADKKTFFNTFWN